MPKVQTIRKPVDDASNVAVDLKTAEVLPLRPEVRVAQQYGGQQQQQGGGYSQIQIEQMMQQQPQL